MNIQITLYFKQGSSDKVYQASIEPQGSGYVVNFAYGRRGSTLTTGTKTQTPVGLDDATKIYDKLLNAKKAKGYTEGEAGTPYVGTSGEPRHTGIAPQLLIAIEENTVETLIGNPFYAAQEKFDGKRMFIRAAGGVVEAINRRGLVCGMPDDVYVAARALHDEEDEFTLDGEAVGDVFYAFDVLAVRGEDLTALPYEERERRLAMLISPYPSKGIKFTPSAAGTVEKRALLASLRERGAEGIVFKHLDAPYTPGRPASGGTQFKFKFTASATLRVVRVNARRSIAVCADAPGGEVNVGNCTIPPNKPIPQPGDNVEVRYLYAYRGGSLYQPVYVGPRDDVDVDLYETLKFKAESADDAGE